MPIYEYSCKKCGETIEVIQKFSDPVLKKHQGCGGTLTKLISAAGFQFKGTGWYVTDYARKGKEGDSEGSRDKGESAAKSESAAKTDTPSREKSPSKTPAGESSKGSGGSGKSGEK
jgi:putative FmdB family regulatory protein